MNQLFKNIVLWLVIFVTFIALYQFFQTPRKDFNEIAFSEFLSNLKNDEISEVVIKGEEIKGNYINKKATKGELSRFKTIGVVNDEVLKLLQEQGVVFKFEESKDNSLVSIFLN